MRNTQPGYVGMLERDVYMTIDALCEIFQLKFLQGYEANLNGMAMTAS